MPEPILALEAVTLLSPEGRPVFQDLDWRLERGARHHVKGGQGSGATAFLRLCAGIAVPEAGRVVLDGTPLDPDRRSHPLLERGALGWVPSDGGLVVNLSLLDNIALPLRFARNLPRSEAEALALAQLEATGLGQRALQRPHVPGDGQSWLVSLARAAARAPELWLVDRPAGGLDAKAIRAARQLLETAAQDPGVTLVLVGGDWMSGLGEPLTIEDGRVQTGSAT